MLLPIQLTALFTGLATWYCAPTRIPVFSMSPTPAAAVELTSSLWGMIHFHVSMAPYSQSPKSLSLLWLQLPNQNLQPFLSQHETWFPTGKPSSLWDGHNQNLLSKLITPPPSVLLTKRFCPARPRWWICVYGGLDAVDLKTSFDTTGMLDPKTGSITTPNIIQTPNMKPTGQLMLVSGNRLAPKSTANLPNHWPTGFPLQVIPFSFHFSFFKTIEHYFPTLWMLPQGCVDPLIPGHGQTIPRSVSRPCQHHLNVAREPSWLS